MKVEEKLILALEFLSEGRRARVPKELSRRTFTTESFLKAAEKLKKTALPWTQGRGIQGLGIGEKECGGRVTRKLALRVYVEKKKPRSKVRNPVPKRFNIPQLGEFTTDVVEIGKVELELFTNRVRPPMPGCGLSLPGLKVGTFGCVVKKKTDGFLHRAPHILSNSHILADDGTANVGDKVIQPAFIDGGQQPEDVIANLEDWVPFVFTGTGYPNYVDAAIAKLRRNSLVQKKIRILGVAPAGIGWKLTRGMLVKKVGRTTDLTCGIIKDIHYRTAFQYKRPGGGTGRVGFREQVLCTRYTANGDSGSVVLNRRNRVVGLHFAGSPSSSIFNRITFVFKALGIGLL